MREAHRAHFRPSVDLRPNRFAWMGSTKPLDAFTFSFRETAHGIFIAHAYQYEPGHSTWVLETDPDTFARAGLEAMTEAQSKRFLERVFAEDLDGHKLITNRSAWRRFPMIRNARCVMDNVVLLGDAKSTAHFSIGAGTKLAMEDAIALFESFRAQSSIGAALAHFEAARREEVERTQHAADVSLVWFEHISRFARMDPVQFAFGLMTRSKSITYDNLRLRAPAFVDATDRMFAAKTCANGFAVDVEDPVPPMFQPLALRGMVVPNRVVVSPMCMYSATDGLPGRFSSGPLRQPGDRRRRADGDGNGLRFRRGAHHAGLRRPLQRRAGSRLDAHRRIRARPGRRQVLPATRPFRPQGGHQADVGRHRPAAGAWRLGDHGAIAPALLPGQPDPPRNDTHRHGSRARGISSPPRGAGCAAGSTWSNCIAPTATCWAVSSHR